MKIVCRQAVIAFCDDLTAPSARVIPVACLLVGETDGARVAALAGIDPGMIKLDPLSATLLKNVPRLVQEHVEQALEGLPEDFPLVDLLHSLHNSLRNSLHVSKVIDPIEVEVSDASELVPKALGVATSTLFQELAETGTLRVRPIESPVRPMPSDVGPIPRGSVWPLGAGGIKGRGPTAACGYA